MLEQKINPIETKDALGEASLVSKKEKKFRTFARFRLLYVGLISIVLLWIVSIPFIAVNIPNNRDAHSIGSIAFDKWQMNRVNKIEVKDYDETILTIYDEEFTKVFINHTMVAKATGFNSVFGRYTVLLYSEGSLVRKMDLCELGSLVRVYSQSPKHWFFWTSGMSTHCNCCGGGLVELPRYLSEEIWQLIIEYS